MPCETDVAFTLVCSLLFFGVIANTIIWSEKQRHIHKRTRRAYYAKNRKEGYAK